MRPPREARPARRRGFGRRVLAIAGAALVCAGCLSGVEPAPSPAATPTPSGTTPSSTPPSLDPTSTPTAIEQLTGTLGAFGLRRVMDVDLAKAAGVQVLVTPHGPALDELSSAAEAAGLKLVDSQIQQMLYHAVCPTGPQSCHPLDSPGRAALLEAVRGHVAMSRRDSSVIAYYLLDDNWTSFRDLLADIGRTLKATSPETPTVCGLALSVIDRRAGSAARLRANADFTNALRNYSPQWCDAVLIYAYGPSGRSSAQDVDWTMSTTLPWALTRLRESGWNASVSPLIGTPQAFSFGPRTTRGGRSIPPEYHSGPTPHQLTAQVRAFCAAGAQAIIAYAWDDGSSGVVTELSSSPDLRLALRDGVAWCRSSVWTAPGPRARQTSTPRGATESAVSMMHRRSLRRDQDWTYSRFKRTFSGQITSRLYRSGSSAVARSCSS